MKQIEVINNLSKIIGLDQNSIDVYNTFKNVEKAINNNEISTEIDTEINNILNGMCFRIKETREVSIVFGKKYIDTYNPNSSFHYTILIHEFKHAYDYLLDKSTVVDSSPKAFHLKELSALKIEAELIKYYLFDKFNLTEIEKYILQSYEADNLDSASTLIQDDSSSIFLFFDKLEADYLSKYVSKDVIISNLIQKGHSLLNDYYYAIDEMSILLHSIRISSYHKYLNGIIRIIGDGNKNSWLEFNKNNPQIEKLFKSMDELLCRNYKVHMQYMNNLYSFWEMDILNNLKKC